MSRGSRGGVGGDRARPTAPGRGLLRCVASVAAAVIVGRSDRSVAILVAVPVFSGSGRVAGAVHAVVPLAPAVGPAFGPVHVEFVVDNDGGAAVIRRELQWSWWGGWMGRDLRSRGYCRLWSLFHCGLHRRRRRHQPKAHHSSAVTARRALFPF